MPRWDYTEAEVLDQIKALGVAWYDCIRWHTCNTHHYFAVIRITSLYETDMNLFVEVEGNAREDDFFNKIQDQVSYTLVAPHTCTKVKRCHVCADGLQSDLLIEAFFLTL